MATQQQYPKSARKRATSSGAVQSRAATGQINSGYRFAATTGDNVGGKCEDMWHNMHLYNASH